MKTYTADEYWEMVCRYQEVTARQAVKIVSLQDAYRKLQAKESRMTLLLLGLREQALKNHCLHMDLCPSDEYDGSFLFDAEEIGDVLNEEAWT